MPSALFRWFKTAAVDRFGPRRTRPRSAPPARVPRLAVEALEDRTVPAVHTWTGGGENNLWSNPDNWDAVGGVPTSNEPGVGTNLFFLENTSSVMDIVGLVVDRIQFTRANNTITLSTPLGVSGDAIIVASAGLGTALNTITGAQLNAPTGLFLSVGASSTLLIESPISGTQGVSQTTGGGGTLILRGTQSYSGTTTVSLGTLELPAGVSLLNSPVVIDGGTLAGSGTVATLNGGPRGGQVAPGGGGSTQTLTVGNAFFKELAYRPAIDGASADRLRVIGTVDLTGGSLAPLPSRAPTAASYTLIDNEGPSPIAGTFTGLPEGAVLFIADQTYRISYVGGDGNDVVLTRTGDPPTPPVSPPALPVPPTAVSPAPRPSSPPAFSGAWVLGRVLVLSGASVPGGIQFTPVPVGSSALFTDLTGDGNGDVVLFLPNQMLVIDGQTGRAMALDVDDNGDGARDLLIFNPDGTATRIDGRTGIALVL